MEKEIQRSTIMHKTAQRFKVILINCRNGVKIKISNNIKVRDHYMQVKTHPRCIYKKGDEMQIINTCNEERDLRFNFDFGLSFEIFKEW